MTVDLTAAIVRILGPSGTTAGTGFVVTRSGLILTCAHVVELANARPGDIVRIAFRTREHVQAAEILPEYWVAPGKEDTALLRVKGVLPIDVRPLPLGTAQQSQYHRFETFGFPAANPDEGLVGAGEIRGSTSIRGIQALQLSSSELTAGFSGAPVWDLEDQRVVGMVTDITPPDSYQRLRSSAFALPSDAIVGIYPQLVSDPRAFETLRRPITVGPGAEPTLRAGEPLRLQGKRYLVREVIAQRSFGMLTVRTARASDVSLGRDVALRQLESASDVPEVQVTLSQSIRHAGVLGQAAARCEHLPQVYDVVDERPHAAWWVMEWIRGTALRQLLPEDGALPDGSAVLELLGWIADVCDALAELKRRRVSHGRVHEAGICLPRGRRGAVLVAPDFVASLGPVAVVSVGFDPVKDIRDLTAVVYRLVTDQTTTAAVARAFNPIVPASLDETLRDGLAGAIKSPGQLKHRLLAARRKM